MPTKQAHPGYLSTDDVAEHFGVTAYTVREWLKSGELRGEKWGGRWHVPESELDRFGLPDPRDLQPA